MTTPPPQDPGQPPYGGPPYGGPPYGSGPGPAPGPEEPARVPGRRRSRLFSMPDWWTDQPEAPALTEWAQACGWAVSDGDAAEDAPLVDLIASAPMRLDAYHHARGVVRGQAGSWRMTAFEIVYERGRDRVGRYAVTAALTLVALPTLRLVPARFWSHKIGGMMVQPSGDQAFDTRWTLLVSEDTPMARALLTEPVRALLLASEDRDEIWYGAGHLAIARTDNHHPDLLTWHTQVLSTLLSAVSFGS
ncbi:MAG: hypothetical protein ACR2J5_07090 [Geodermatophilaceae bacterium]